MNRKGRGYLHRVELFKLHCVGVSLGLISFFMGFVVLIFLMYQFFKPLFPKNGSIPFATLLEIFSTERNLYLLLLCFCGFMMERPTSWLVSLSEDPYEFFVNDLDFFKRYHPKFWLLYWTSVIFIILFTLNALKSGHVFASMLYTAIGDNFPILVSCYMISIMCIGLIQYYKKLMVGAQ